MMKEIKKQPSWKLGFKNLSLAQVNNIFICFRCQLHHLVLILSTLKCSRNEETSLKYCKMRFKCHACDNIIESEQTCNLIVFVGLIWIKEEDGGSGA